MPSTLRARLWVASFVNEQVGRREEGSLLHIATRSAGPAPAAPNHPPEASGPGSLPSSSSLAGQTDSFTYLDRGLTSTNRANGTLVSMPRLLKALQAPTEGSLSRKEPLLHLLRASGELRAARMYQETWDPKEGQAFFLHYTF